MVFPGYNAPFEEPPAYSYRINDDNSFTVFQNGEEVETSRAFRLRTQAERQAIEWIQREVNTPPADITLNVQSVSMDVAALFNRSKR